MDITFSLKGIYFDQIKSGVKEFEYRLITDYWSKRLIGRTYDGIWLTRGYPKRDDKSRRIYRPWCGYEVHTIRHDHFGPVSVKVFAIRVNNPTPKYSC